MKYMCDLCRKFFEQKELILETRCQRDDNTKNISRVLSCKNCLPLLDNNRNEIMLTYKREPFAGGSSWRYGGGWCDV